jgi:hypothetical protein
VTQRTLLGPREQSSRCTPAQLLTDMERSFDEVRRLLGEVADAWRWQLSRLAGSETEVAALRAATSSPPAELAALESALDALSTAVTRDPLGTGPEAFVQTETGLARARAAITSAEELQARLEHIRRDGPELLAAAESCYAEACALHVRALDRIAGHQAPAPLAPDPRLRAELAALSADPTRPGGPLLAWQRRAQAALDQARADRDFNRAPLAERHELRGRLDGYLAKAAGFGLAESTQLDRMAQRARVLLYSAPCDLDAARGAVAAYTKAVTAATTGGDR